MFPLPVPVFRYSNTTQTHADHGATIEDEDEDAVYDVRGSAVSISGSQSMLWFHGKASCVVQPLPPPPLFRPGSLFPRLLTTLRRTLFERCNVAVCCADESRLCADMPRHGYARRYKRIRELSEPLLIKQGDFLLHKGTSC